MTFQRASLPLTATFSSPDCFRDISLPVAIVCRLPVVSIGIDAPSGTRQYSLTFQSSTHRIDGPKRADPSVDSGSGRQEKRGLDLRMQTEPAIYLRALSDSHRSSIGLGKLHRVYLPSPRVVVEPLRPQAATHFPEPKREVFAKRVSYDPGIRSVARAFCSKDGFNGDSLVTQPLWRSQLKKEQPPHLTSPQMIKALSHATRVHALTVLNERAASPKEIAAELDRSIQHVGYHLEKLEELGCIEMVETKKRHGGRVTEHFYRALQRPWFDREAWKQSDPQDRPGFTSSIMGNINEDIATAIKGGTLNGKDNHISRTPVVLDPDSYEELLVLLAKTLNGIFAIKERAANRIGPDTKTIATVIEIIQFDLPTSDFPK